MNNLTKDINNIVNNYLDISNKHLIKIIPKIRISRSRCIKDGIMLFDILIKCLQLGYNGFFINSNNCDDFCLLDEINDDRISYDVIDEEYYFYFNIPELNHMDIRIDINRLDIFDFTYEHVYIIN